VSKTSSRNKKTKTEREATAKRQAHIEEESSSSLLQPKRGSAPQRRDLTVGIEVSTLSPVAAKPTFVAFDITRLINALVSREMRGIWTSPDPCGDPTFGFTAKDIKIRGEDFNACPMTKLQSSARKGSMSPLDFNHEEAVKLWQTMQHSSSIAMKIEARLIIMLGRHNSNTSIVASVQTFSPAKSELSNSLLQADSDRHIGRMFGTCASCKNHTCLEECSGSITRNVRQLMNDQGVDTSTLTPLCHKLAAHLAYLKMCITKIVESNAFAEEQQKTIQRAEVQANKALKRDDKDKVINIPLKKPLEQPKAYVTIDSISATRFSNIFHQVNISAYSTYVVAAMANPSKTQLNLLCTNRQGADLVKGLLHGGYVETTAMRAMVTYLNHDESREADNLLQESWTTRESAIQQGLALDHVTLEEGFMTPGKAFKVSGSGARPTLTLGADPPSQDPIPSIEATSLKLSSPLQTSSRLGRWKIDINRRDSERAGTTPQSTETEESTLQTTLSEQLFGQIAPD